MPRTIFIGDIHGCLTELEMLVDKLRITTADRVICIGDLVNKGPHSAAVVRYVYRRGFECVRGNHDQAYIAKHEKASAFKKIRRSLTPEEHAWLCSLPYYIDEDAFLAVHAGVVPEQDVSEIDPQVLMNIRTWGGGNGELTSLDNPPWYELYHGPKTIIYGHWAAAGLTIRNHTKGLDSGCVYGNQLTAYVLDRDEIVQVAAQRCYQPIR